MSSPHIDTLSVKVHRCRKEPHFDAICVRVYCVSRSSLKRRFSLSYVSLCVLFSLEFLRGLSSAVSGLVEVGEEHEEDRRMK